MINLQYINETEIYNVKINQVNKNIIRVIGNIPSKTNGFIILKNNTDKILGDYSDFTTIYRELDDGVEFSNNNTTYIKNLPRITFLANEGGILDGELIQDSLKYEDIIIPTPIPNDEYEFARWNPSIPDSGDIKSNQVFTAIFANSIEMLEKLKELKINEFSEMCNAIIESGQEITLSDGNSVYFKYTQYDQMNLETALNLSLTTKESIPFYDGDNNCHIYSLEDLITIYVSCKSYVTYMLTLDHQLEDMIKVMNTKEDIEALDFGVEYLDEEHRVNFDTLLSQAQKVSEKYIQSMLVASNE